MQLETIKNINTEITNYKAEHHSKELTEKLCYEDHFIKKFKPKLNRRLQNPNNWSQKVT